MEQIVSFDQLPTLVSGLCKKIDSIEKLLLNRNSEQSPESHDQLLTVHEAANFLSLAVPTVYSMVSKGELPVMKRSKRLYFSRLELMDYLKAGRKKSLAETASEAENYLKTKKC